MNQGSKLRLSLLGSFFKFKIGAIVAPIAEFDIPEKKLIGLVETRELRMHIIERSIQQCIGGYQANYKCRTHGSGGTMDSKYMEFNEIELKIWKPRKIKNDGK